MLATNKSGTILIRDNTPLPTGMAIERDVFLPGWNAVKDLDGYQLCQKIEGAKWNFFYLAGEIRVTVLGRDRLETLRKAVKHVLAKRVDQKFNSLQITNVVAKRFLGIPFVKLTAHSRHIQESIFLGPNKGSSLGNSTSCCARNWLAQKHEATSDGSGNKATYGFDFKFLGTRGEIQK